MSRWVVGLLVGGSGGQQGSRGEEGEKAEKGGGRREGRAS